MAHHTDDIMRDMHDQNNWKKLTDSDKNICAIFIISSVVCFFFIA